MQKLKDVMLRMKQEQNRITQNPLLGCFAQDELGNIDIMAETDDFILEKKATILKLIEGMQIDFNEKLKSAFDEYNEALVYLKLRQTFPTADRIKEKKNVKTPDFHVPIVCVENEGTEQETVNEYNVYVELKTLSFADGNNVYKDVMQQALNAQIDIEDQLRRGSRIAFGIHEVAPLQKSGATKKTTTKDEIAAVIDKINQNIKEDQFSSGDTILFVDMTQLGTQSHPLDMAAPVFQDFRLGSNVSGLLWNVAFGRHTDRIYKPIDFEGQENIDEDLGRDGILTAFQFIKAICFRICPMGGKPQLIGMIRHREESEGVVTFLHKICDHINDDMNAYDWKRVEMTKSQKFC